MNILYSVSIKDCKLPGTWLGSIIAGRYPAPCCPPLPKPYPIQRAHSTGPRGEMTESDISDDRSAPHPMSRSTVSFASVTPANCGTVKKLNSVIFPIRYSLRFYSDIVAPEVEDFCKLVYYNDVPVGTVCCRIEKGGHEGDTNLYVMTMGILAPYRSRKLGTETLRVILKAAASHTKPKISRIRLHVQESNEDARRFYERHGFAVVGKDPEYYKKIEPHGAWILERDVREDDKTLSA